MEHMPVLLKECIDGLSIKADGIYVDGTLGYGGHSREIAARLREGRLIAIDRDDAAIGKARELLADYDSKITYVKGNFRDLPKIMDASGVEYADGMLFDLGVSSPQLDSIERGFSYMHNASLDMRMDKKDELTAFEAVNNWTEDKLRTVFYEYGEERYAGQIARLIVSRRINDPIKSTFDLNGIIFSAIPSAARREPQHPSKRCFQALRIAVNDELGAISDLLDKAPERLRVGGRLCVISFHSLEDRLVKNSFAARARGCVCPSDFPVCVCNVTPVLRLITKKPVRPGDDEIKDNPRARSAKLRIAQRI